MSYGQTEREKELQKKARKRWRRSIALAAGAATLAAGAFAYTLVAPAAVLELRGSTASQEDLVEAFHRAPPLRLSATAEPARHLPALGLDAAAILAAALDLEQDAVRMYPLHVRDWAAEDGDRIALRTAAHYSEHVLSSDDHTVFVLVPSNSASIELVALSTGWPVNPVATPAVTDAAGKTIELPRMQAGDVARIPVALE